jgi:hypothetical protein
MQFKKYYKIFHAIQLVYMKNCLFILRSFEDLNYCLVWCDRFPNGQMLITFPPVVCTYYTETGMGLLIDGMYVVPPSSNVVVVDTSTFGTFHGEREDPWCIWWMLSSLLLERITLHQRYQIVSVKILNINVLLLIIKLNFMMYLQVDIKNWKFWKTI